VNAPTRECRGCSGTGCKYPLCEGRRGRLILNAHSVECIACPVCAGSGQVEAKPGVRDAVADAETLTENVDLRRIALAFRDVLIAREQGLPWFGARGARQAARAAFRAVPGLRGE
jgi:hypothetical protein